MHTWPGELGFVLVDLAFVSAAVAAIALLWVWWRPASAPAGLQRVGRVAFGIHTCAVLGIFITLLGLVIAGQYQYHYAWKHASNELSLRFVVASIWEGQEGSFLIWMVWHALLGLVVLRWGGAWKDGVLGIVATVQVILGSMILGVYFSHAVSALLFGLALLLPLAWLVRYFLLVGQRLAAYGMALLMVLIVTNLVREQGGFFHQLTTPAYALEALFATVVLLLSARALHRQQWPLAPTVGFVLGGVLLLVLGNTALGAWKVGSSPFILLRDALPDTPIFQTNPEFVPVNGTGLNPLLQNYWMVIHPPTLFLGFALTLFPFAYLVAGLLRGATTDWVKPAAAWNIAAMGVLGVGILMGGYWAYETLNFGGYWNWDPVENASLVPWLTGVGAIHALLSYRHGQRNLKLAASLLVATFILVLYSTFLVRSGILGESSVHSFTDLGLSGQLLLLLLGYLLFVLVLLAKRWVSLPAPTSTAPLLSRETFLLLAAVVLTLSATQIAVATSLPVINAVAGTNLAPPAHVPRYYYGWQVWFATAIGVLSAVGQYLYWNRMEKGNLSRALFGPFVAAAGLTLVAMLTLYLTGRGFVYNESFRVSFQAVQEQGSWLGTAVSAVTTSLLFVADELLLFAALFGVFANAVVLVRLIRRSARAQGKVGGSLAHIGFALLLIGVVFSAGYEDTVSVNLTPQELGAAFPQDAKADNVLLVRGQPKTVPGFQVAYSGKEVAQAPIGELSVLQADAQNVKVKFPDGQGRMYALDVPQSFFQFIPSRTVASTEKKTHEPSAEELSQLRTFIETNLRLIEPPPLDGRTRYPITFIPLRKDENQSVELDSAKAFTLYPEAEISNGEGLLSHPSTHHTLLRDLYVFVSSIPADESDTAETQYEVTEVRLGLRDTAKIGPYSLRLEEVVRVEGNQEFAGYDIALKAKVRVGTSEGSLLLNPHFLIKGLKPTHQDAQEQALGLTLRFEGVAPAENKFVFLLQQEKAPPDYLTFKALRKPLILLVWLGAGIMAVGFAVAGVRRGQEHRKSQRL